MSGVNDSSVWPTTSGASASIGRHAQLVAAPDRERQAVALEAVGAVGLQDDVGGRVVGVGVHRVGAVERAARSGSGCRGHPWRSWSGSCSLLGADGKWWRARCVTPHTLWHSKRSTLSSVLERRPAKRLPEGSRAMFAALLRRLVPGLRHAQMLDVVISHFAEDGVPFANLPFADEGERGALLANAGGAADAVDVLLRRLGARRS